MIFNLIDLQTLLTKKLLPHNPKIEICHSWLSESENEIYYIDTIRKKLK
jgi:hypothetical protein